MAPAGGDGGRKRRIRKDGSTTPPPPSSTPVGGDSGDGSGMGERDRTVAGDNVGGADGAPLGEDAATPGQGAPETLQDAEDAGALPG